MTKYNKKALDAAEDAVAFSHALTNRAIATAVFDTLTRAPWWEEVAGDYGVDFGEPFREECAGRAWEHSNEGPYRPISSFAHEGSLFRYFRDTRWTPPPVPLAVGDLIETVAQAEWLPLWTIAVSAGNTAFRKVGVNEWRRVDNLPTVPLTDFKMAGQDDRIIYLPRGDSE